MAIDRKYAPSDTVPGQLYTVDTVNGGGVCDCMGFRSHGHCKHVRRALEEEKNMTNDSNAPVADDQALTVAQPPAAIMVNPPPRVLPTMQELAVMGKIAATLVNARGHAIPTAIDSPSKAAAVMLAGWELGLRPMTAFRHVYVVNGRTEPDAQVMMGLVLAKDPHAQFIWHERTAQACDVELRRPGRTPVRIKYTIKDAEAAGQTKTSQGREMPTWKLYPTDMLTWAAIKRCCRLGAADIINAIPSIDVGDMGDMIEGVAEEIAEPAPEDVQAAMLPEPDAAAELDEWQEQTAQGAPEGVDRETGEIIDPREDPVALTDAEQAALFPRVPRAPASKAHP